MALEGRRPDLQAVAGLSHRFSGKGPWVLQGVSIAVDNLILVNDRRQHWRHVGFCSRKLTTHLARVEGPAEVIRQPKAGPSYYQAALAPIVR